MRNVFRFHSVTPWFGNRLSGSLLCLLLVQPFAMAYAGWQLDYVEWTQPRSAADLMQLPAITSLMQAYQQDPSQTILLRHGAGEIEEIWCRELRSWLIALGVDSDHIRLESDPLILETLQLSLKP